MNAGPFMRGFCGQDKFGEQEDGSYHSYVEAMAGSSGYGSHINMADCKACRIEYHKQELERLEEEED